MKRSSPVVYDNTRRRTQGTGGQMLLDIEKTDAPRGFRLVGELDASNVTSLSDALQPEIERGGDLTLDLAGLAFMDSTGIQVLVRTAQGLEGRGDLILVSPGSLVRRILELIPVQKLDNVRIVGEE
ncbi:MAG TPA: STAS domain-containing protein [Actinomycetota bacterium]|nr:STAS domain-containing protein [Actinomycetota bacterium]